MKQIIITVSMLLCAVTFAKSEKKREPQQVVGQVGKMSESIFFVNDKTGKPEINKAVQYMGFAELCFAGDPEVARKEIYAIIKNDAELKSGFAKYVKKNNQIVYGYVDTKCLDEGDTEESDCRAVRIANSCSSVSINAKDQVIGEVGKDSKSTYNCNFMYVDGVDQENPNSKDEAKLKVSIKSNDPDFGVPENAASTKLKKTGKFVQVSLKNMKSDIYPNQLGVGVIISNDLNNLKSNSDTMAAIVNGTTKSFQVSATVKGTYYNLVCSK